MSPCAIPEAKDSSRTPGLRCAACVTVLVGQPLHQVRDRLPPAVGLDGNAGRGGGTEVGAFAFAVAGLLPGSGDDTHGTAVEVLPVPEQVRGETPVAGPQGETGLGTPRQAAGSRRRVPRVHRLRRSRERHAVPVRPALSGPTAHRRGGAGVRSTWDWPSSTLLSRHRPSTGVSAESSNGAAMGISDEPLSEPSDAPATGPAGSLVLVGSMLGPLTVVVRHIRR